VNAQYICLECGKLIFGYRSKVVKFCSLECRNNNYKKRPAPFLGKKHTEENKKRQSKLSLRLGLKPPKRTGIEPWNKGKEIYYNRGDNNCMKNPITRQKNSEKQRGSNGNNWKGGVSGVNKIIRNSLLFKMWREAVFKRDNFTCQECGRKKVTLHPHHIKHFALFPDLRFELNNGITLCKKCHQEKHKKIKLSVE
jgi:DNA-directed RNA polymerase subunit M/transcription elongation factor TFIIS